MKEYLKKKQLQSDAIKALREENRAVLQEAAEVLEQSKQWRLQRN